MTRRSGVLCPITALPSPFGAGDLGASARAFADCLAACGQRVWQLLPLTVPDEYGSPYASPSAFAGDPMQIDPFGLAEDGLLSVRAVQESDKTSAGRAALLREAYRAFRDGGGERRADYTSFCRREAYWLRDFALFDAVREAEGRPFPLWKNGALRRRERAAVSAAEARLTDALGLRCFTQYVFQRQLDALRAYLTARGISLMGDMPLYVSGDSADVWVHPSLFALDGDGRVRLAAGVPPDCFSEVGQLWGNPVYDWAAMARDRYAWWQARIRRARGMYDVLRIDHFRGLDSYYAIPMPASDARAGEWMRGPGLPFFDAIRPAQKDMPLVAEDLGNLTPSVHGLRERLGLPGMRVLQFAFDTDAQDAFLPHNYGRHTVAYLGTHDNDTTLGWWASADGERRRRVAMYLGLPPACAPRQLLSAMLRVLSASVADTVIFSLPDLRGEGSEGRLNTPGMPERSWRYRVQGEILSPWTARYLTEITKLYGRWEEGT